MKLDQIQKYMKDPNNYPHQVKIPIKEIETHISLVYLTGEYAYKLKKPVTFGEILDFSTLQNRQYYCKEELRLNKRLAPDMYKAVLSLFPGGISYDLENKMEYCVKMIQYPEQKIMKNILDRGGTITKDQITRIAKQLYEFHENSRIVPEAGEISAVKQKILENFKTISKYRKINEEYKVAVMKFLERKEDLFSSRVVEDRIRDCHGDIQPRNIFCLDQREIIFDCIEFNPDLRCGDIVEEIAFLAMELDRYELNKLSNHFIKKYTSFADDDSIYQLINFYKSYRAYVRAKVGLFGLDTIEDKGRRDELMKEVEIYLTLAYNYELGA